MSEVEELLREIDQEVRLTRKATGCDRLRPEVRQALRDVPREAFLPEDLRPYAYENRPLPIGDGQTISQPYIVAIMTELLDPQPGDQVLEIGTGSGYQAAVLSRIVRKVYSVETIEELGRRAARIFRELGYDNIEARIGDGYHGWPEHAPFDGIIVTAAAPEIPPPLVEQLKPGARLVIPVGGLYGQDLLVVDKDEDGEVHSRHVLPVAFVPLTGDHGQH